MKEIQMSLTQWVQSLHPKSAGPKRQYKRRGTSRTPPKGMVHAFLSDRDSEGMDVFVNQAQAPDPAAGKSWFAVQVVRVVTDGKGEIVRKNKQVTTLFTTPEKALGTGMRRCPDPWPGQEPRPKESISMWKATQSTEL